ncbi:signal peptidase I [Streptomyces sp. NBC_00006]|uniref:signal peptidase I n=2 Tax=unclassified Streptomyces TaxID=2593676 RepID=UPI0022515CB9|nr:MULTISPECIES: signal peptidase I [unclassified Streptomyces]MCX5531011.1 signal peptidase I [Streptomyces sp. NBC_00006]
MGDLAVGARSGHGPEEEPGRSDDAAGPGPEGRTPETGDGSTMSEAQSSGGSKGGSKKPRSFWKELPLLIGIALVLALVIKTFLVQAFSIPSASMENTLKIGDRVLVDKLTPWFGSEPERGEVIVFHDPASWLEGEPTPEPNAVQTLLSWVGLMPSANEKDLIKRVVGVGGDTVECNGTGPLKINGKALNEPYVYPGNTPCSDDNAGGTFKVKVPKGKVWVMGDHRQDSMDSRYHQNDKNSGFVPVDNVVGRAIVVAWPPTHWSTLPVPDTFDQSGINAVANVAPGALGLAGAAPLVLWRRRKINQRVTEGNTRVSAAGGAR